MKTGPLPLAVLRVSVAAVWLTLPQVHHVQQYVALGPVTAPAGLGWLVPLVNPSLAQTAQIAVFAGATAGLLGSRLGLGLVAVAGTYLLGIAQLQGGVQHFHHLVWFAALLAFSPCTDALTPTQLRPRPGTSRRWGIPTAMAWALIAIVFFFPGVHKIAAYGLDWAGTPLRNILLWKWASAWDFAPLFRVDRWPTLLWLGGLGVLAFELTAPLMMLTRRGRHLFVGVALLFHFGTATLFAIDFSSLWLCYGVLLGLPTRPVEAPIPPENDRPWRTSVAMGGLLLLGATVAGISGQTQAWPFACYPTFATPVPDSMPTLAVQVDGMLVPNTAFVAPEASQQHVSEAWGLLGLYGPVQPGALPSFCSRIRERFPDAGSVVLHRARTSIDPDRPSVFVGDRLHRCEPVL